jgi:hypothetical protein
MISMFVSLAKFEKLILLLFADESWAIAADLLQATRVDHSRDITNIVNIMKVNPM